MKLTFGLWAKLEAQGPVRMHSLRAAKALEVNDIAASKIIGRASLPYAITQALHVRRSRKQHERTRDEERMKRDNVVPTALYIQAYNPSAVEIAISFTIRQARDAPLFFQDKIILNPGYQRHRVPIELILNKIDLCQQYFVQVTIANDVAGSTIYFGLLDFVKETQRAIHPPSNKTMKAKVKCVVWDLDNTIWKGTLVEDGIDRVELKTDAIALIRQLDARGILQSVASKNNYDDAMHVLKRFGIDEYFLFPQISWRPKSLGVSLVAKSLNISIDSLALIDDQPFELAQVACVYPEIRTIDASEIPILLERWEFDVPVTDESRNRRSFYRSEQERINQEASFEGSYLAFLRECRMILQIEVLSASSLERVHELAQRTNQMNFSGNRYSRTVLEEIASSNQHDTYVMRCSDRFGNYGTIGVAVVELNNVPTLIDIMFSCRVQGKRIEHAFLSHIVSRYRAEGFREFRANYRRTPRNEAAGRVFDDFGFKCSETLGDVRKLVFDYESPIPDDKIVTIEDATDRQL
jgi:FkbH-like protein